MFIRAHYAQFVLDTQLSAGFNINIEQVQMLKTYSHIRRQALNVAAAALEPSFLRASTLTADAELIN
jgi:hypothetical protein